MRTITTPLLAFLLVASASASDLGRRFEFSIPPNFRQPKPAATDPVRTSDATSSDRLTKRPQQPRTKGSQLWLTITGTLRTTVFISAGAVLDTALDVPANTTVELILPEQLETVDPQTHQQTPIAVTSTEDVRLLIVSHRRQTTEAFTVLPEEMYGSRYILASYDRLSDDLMSQASITTIDQPAQVTIIHGDSVLTRMAMPPHASYLLEATSGINDLTGVEIRSTAPVSVVTSHRCAYVPAKVEACNVLLEHLPPVPAMGSTYVIPVRPDAAPMRCRLIAAGEAVNITVGGQSYAISRGSFEEITVTDAPLIASGDAPFIVALYTQGFKSSPPEDSLQLPDPSLVILPPAGAGSDRTTISITNPFEAKYQIAIMGSINALADLRLNGLPTLADVKPVGNGWGMVATEVEPGRLTLQASGAVTAVVWSTGIQQDAYDGYAFTVGW